MLLEGRRYIHGDEEERRASIRMNNYDVRQVGDRDGDGVSKQQQRRKRIMEAVSSWGSVAMTLTARMRARGWSVAVNNNVARSRGTGGEQWDYAQAMLSQNKFWPFLSHRVSTSLAHARDGE